MIMLLRTAFHLSLLTMVTACSLSPDLPEQSPPLADMEEPLELRTEPNDDDARLAMPLGMFSGIYLADAHDTLAAKLDEAEQLQIARVIENSPADQAGLQVGDLVLEVAVDDGEAKAITRPSEWRQIEQNAKPDSVVKMIVDRAGREARTELRLVPRLRAPERTLTERYREEQRIGVVVRTATEVEARQADLGPGGGAVIVGLSQRSPWRTAGLRFGDLLVAIDQQAMTHPQELLAAARDEQRTTLDVTFVRDGKRQTVTAPLTAREHEMNEISLPLLFSYESDRGRSEWSLLLGIFNYRSTAAAWRFRLLWLIGFGGGDADQLLEQDG
jgi:C-terminal processing protease CtpA/Prc